MDMDWIKSYEPVLQEPTNLEKMKEVVKSFFPNCTDEFLEKTAVEWCKFREQVKSSLEAEQIKDN